MIVAVTGANGFIGSHLVQDQIRQGRCVRAVDLRLPKLQKLSSHPGLRLIQGDIRNRDLMRQALAGADLVFHLASAHLSLSLDETEYWEINAEGSRTLVELAHQLKVPGFIHCSTVGVHGEITDPPGSEDSPCRPQLVYEKSKLRGEKLVQDYAVRTGYPVTILRPVWVYGPGCPRTEKLFRSVARRRFVYLGNPENHRHCIYIDDMLVAFNCAASRLSSTPAGRTFIIGDPSAVKLRRLIDGIAEVAGARPPTLVFPPEVAKAGLAALEWGFTLLRKEPPVSRRSLKFFSNNTSFSVARAKAELGFESQISLQQGLRLSYAAMKERDRVAHLQ